VPAPEEAESLRRTLDADPTRFDAHERLHELTGPAPRDATPPDPLAHPYDPRVRLAAGREALARGDREAAVEHLDWAVWLADLDLAAARAAAVELAKIDPAWARRGQVGVHVYADETVRRHPGWRFRLRALLKSMTQVLDPVVGMVFLPLTLGEFDAAQADDTLDSIRAAFDGPTPRHGIVLLVTERRAPRRPGRWSLGQAEFLGRRATVRLGEGEFQNRAVAHELLHLYGAVHVPERKDSLMNPSGGEWVIDPENAAIVRALRGRRFGPGGLEANVFPYIDLDGTIAAYLSAIRANLELRQMGIEEVLRETSSRHARARQLRRERHMDPNLGDVCAFAARLLVRADRGALAVALFDTAARLYGPDSPEGRAMLAHSDALRAHLAQRYGLD